MTSIIRMVFALGAAVMLTVRCTGTERESSAKTEALLSTSDTTLSPDLVASWGPQQEFFTEGEFTILDWESAQNLVLQTTYRGGKIYHSGWITIYTHDGGSYLTKEPEPDDFIAYMRQYSLPMDGFAPE